MRISHCALTYSQTGDLFTQQELYDYLCTLGTDKVAVALESHKDGEPHMHAYVHFPKRRQVEPTLFQFRNLCANLELIRGRPNGWFTYMQKEDENILSNFQLPPSQPNHKSQGIKHAIATRLLEDPDCLTDLYKEYPVYSLNGHKHMQAFATIARQLQAPALEPWTGVPGPQPDNCFSIIADWLNANIKQPRAFKQPQLWIWSELPNFGKTSLVDCFAPYLKINRINVLNNGFFSPYNDAADLVVFDDYNRASAYAGDFNRFLQGSPTTINIKGGYCEKTKNPPVIVTSNRQIRVLYPNHYHTVEARFLEVEINEPLFPLIDQIKK